MYFSYKLEICCLLLGNKQQDIQSQIQIHRATSLDIKSPPFAQKIWVNHGEVHESYWGGLILINYWK